MSGKLRSKRIILAGGTGFIGTVLTQNLIAKGYDVTVLSRGTPSGNSPPRLTPATRHSSPVTLPWDARTLGAWATEFEGVLAVVNLAGRSVDCHHTSKNCREIIESRVNSVKVIAQAIGRCSQPPTVWVQAGGEGIYGDAGEGSCDESTPPGEGFLVETCQLWERSFNESATLQTRQVLLRIGFVLGAEGGALKTLAALTKRGLGGTAGNGRQFINWIHEADLNRIVQAAIEQPGMTGVFNASGPNPVTNAEFMRELRHAFHRPWAPPAPAWAVRIGAWFIGSDGRLALTGRCCIPKRLLDHGFRFDFPNLQAALTSFYGP